MPEDNSSALKAKYRELLKKYHPDLAAGNADVGDREEVTKRINEWYAKATAGESPEPPNRVAPSPPNPDYLLYSQAYDLSSAIHPGTWRSNSLVDPLTGSLHTKDIGEQMRIIEKLLSDLVAARTLFRRLVHLFPDSPWRADAEDKVEHLNRLHQRYYAMLGNLW